MDAKEPIKHVLDTADPSLFFCDPEHRVPTSLICWMKVVEFEDLRLILGLSKSGCWVREGNGDVCELSPGEYLLPLLPCLELPRSDFFRRLEDSLKRLKLPSEIVATFPLDDLLITALGSNSEHWLRLVMAWIEPSGITSQLETALRKVAESPDKRIPQRVRHDAWKLVRERYLD